MSLYYPNTAGSSGWRGWESGTPPPAWGWPSATVYTSGNLDTVSADDENHIDEGPDSGPSSNRIAGHRFKIKIAEEVAQVGRIDMTVKALCPQGHATAVGALYIGDVSGTSWELLDSITPLPATKTTLTGFVEADIADYIETNGDRYVWLLAMLSGNIGGIQIDLYFAEVEITLAVVESVLERTSAGLLLRTAGGVLERT